MKTIVAFLATFAVAFASLQSEFLDFQSTYGKSYAASEFQYRFGVFSENKARAAQNQINDPTATYGVTKFMDLTPEEFSRYFMMPKELHRTRPESMLEAEGPEAVAVPTSFDWRNKGAITAVYNQVREREKIHSILEIYIYFSHSRKN